jgi:hypothetical protein
MIRRTVLDKIITRWEQEGRVVRTAAEYQRLERKPMNLTLIRRYVGSYPRLIRWAYRYYPDRMAALEGEVPVEEGTPNVSTFTFPETNVEEPATEAESEPSTTIEPFWTDSSIEESKNE